MTGFGIFAILVILGILSLCFKENRDAKHIFNVVGWAFFGIIAFAAMVFASMMGLG